MRNNIEGARIADCFLVSGNKLSMMRQTLAADNTPLDADTPHLISLDPDGAKELLLPPEAAGLWFIICNWAGGAEAITVKDDSDSTTIGVVNQNTAALFVCDGTRWFALADTDTDT
jgi:hypothetical protein